MKICQLDETNFICFEILFESIKTLYVSYPNVYFWKYDAKYCIHTRHQARRLYPFAHLKEVYVGCHGNSGRLEAPTGWGRGVLAPPPPHPVTQWSPDQLTVVMIVHWLEHAKNMFDMITFFSCLNTIIYIIFFT